MFIRRICLACLGLSIAMAGCGSSGSSSATPDFAPVPSAAHHPSDPSSKTVPNTPLPKPK